MLSWCDWPAGPSHAFLFWGRPPLENPCSYMYVYNTQHLLYIYIYTYIYSFYSIISHCCRSNILAFVWLNQSFGFNLVSPWCSVTPRFVLPIMSAFSLFSIPTSHPHVCLSISKSFWWFKEKAAGNHVISLYYVNLTLNSPAKQWHFHLQLLVPLLRWSRSRPG